MEYLQVHDFGYIENNREIFLLYIVVKNIFIHLENDTKGNSSSKLLIQAK